MPGSQDEHQDDPVERRIAELIAAAPPLTEQTRARLAELLS